MEKKMANETIGVFHEVKIREIMKKSLQGEKIKITHNEGFYKYFAIEVDKKIYINKFIYDFVNDNWFTKTICEVIDGEKVKYEILQELYGDF